MGPEGFFRVFALLLGCFGEIIPLLDPAPVALPGVLFVVRFTPQVPPPAGATRVKLLLDGLPDSTALEIVSSYKLPQVAAIVQDGTSWSLVFGEALPSEEMEFLMRLHMLFVNQLDHIVAAAQLGIAYALESRPVSFKVFEQIPVPLDFQICNTSASLPASSSAPQRPVLASSNSAPNLVRYEFTINLGEASFGDLLQLLPLSAIHTDFGLTAGSACPLLYSQWDQLGVFMSWPAAACFLRSASSRTSNAIDIDIGNPPSVAEIVLSLPAPIFGTVGTWLVVLSGSTCGAAEVAIPNVFVAPSVAFLLVSQASGAVQVDLQVLKNSDLPEALLVSSNFDLLSCQVLTSSWVPSGLTFASAVVTSNVCRVTLLNGWMGPDVQLMLRLSLQPGGGTMTMNAEMEGSGISHEIGWTSLAPANQLTSSLFPTGLAIQRPVVFLITFTTSALQAYEDIGQATNQGTELAQLRLKLLDASRWRLLRAEDGAMLQSIPQNLAVDCAEYIRDFSGPSVPPPRKCWGDAMRTDGDAVSVEWWPGTGLRSSTGYTLEIMGEFLSSTFTGNILLELSIWTTFGGVFVAREIGELASTASAIPKSDVASFMAQQPVINMVSAHITQVNTSSNVSVGLFQVSLQPGNDEKQWLRAGQSLDIFFLPLAAWDFREVAAGITTVCDSLRLMVTSGGDDMVAPTCSAFSVGEAGVGFRQNRLTLVLGSNTLITPYSQGILEVSLPLPATGLFGASVIVACRYQAPAQQGAWHATSSFLQWNPRIASAGFLNFPHGAPGENLTVELALVPGPTLSSYAGAFLLLKPPVDFRILAVELPPADRAWLPLGNLTGAFSNALGARVSIPLAEGTAVFGSAEYFLRLIVVAVAPSFGLREAWHFSIVAGPAEPFHLAGVQSPGVLITGSLSAAVVASVLHASAATVLAVYFQPLQTQGIFFRYLVLTAPLGFEFDVEAVGNACKIDILLALPAQSNCNSSRSEQSRSNNVASVVLPPFWRLEPQEYGFALHAVLPSFAEAWLAESNGRGSFQFETQTDEMAIDTVLLPSSEVFPTGCAQAEVAVGGLVPGQMSVATMAFRLGEHHPTPSSPLMSLYIYAPSGYSWTSPTASWSASVTSGGVASTLSTAEFAPDSLCPHEANVLCVKSTFIMTPEDIITVAAEINIPNENPDDPQRSGLPQPAFWHLKFALVPGLPILPAARWLGCNMNFSAPNQVRRVFSAAVEASNAVISAENDVSFSVTLVTEVLMGGALVIHAPSDVFVFPEPCTLQNIEASGSSAVVGSPLPESAGASCTSNSQDLAAIIFRSGSLSPNTYMFKILGIKNIKIISADDAQYRWTVYTVGAGDSALTTHGTASVSYLDSPRDFKSFAVTVAMQNAFIETQILDVAVTGFTKLRGKMNQVVICFQQALASVSGEVLSVSIPEGFQFPWQDSSDCTQVDASLGVAPVNLGDPFGRGGSPDPATFALFPEGTEIGCTTSIDKRTAFLTISEALVEIARLYAFRLVVRNAERSPASNLWRLEFGAQASLPFPGLTLQAFQRLSISSSYTGASRNQTAIPNVLEILFQPSVPVPPGGALQLIPSQGFQLVPAVPRTSRGVLVRAGARCTGDAIFIGLDYSFEQCEAACSQRASAVPSCEFFRFGIGDQAGVCVQETSACQTFEVDEAFSVYQIAATGNCFRFSLLEDGAARSDVDCSLESRQTISLAGQDGVSDPNATTTVAVFGLAIGSLPLATSKVYTATIAILNPSELLGQSLWLLQSFSQTSLTDEAVLEDGIADGFSLVPALDDFEVLALPESEKHKAGTTLMMNFTWGPRESYNPSLDTVRVEFPSWLNISAACSSLSSSVEISGCTQMLGSNALQLSLSSSLAKGESMEFQLEVRNPSRSVVAALPRGQLSLIQVSHLRRVVLASGETLLQPLAMSGATSHAVQLALPVLRVRQSSPFLAMAGHYPTNLDITFQLASAGVDQVWLDTQSGGNPMDFAAVQCHMAVDRQTAVELFGEVSCYPGGELVIEIDAVLMTMLSRLRVEFSNFNPQSVYTLKARNVRLGFQAGPAGLIVASSTASSSINASDFSQAFLLDRSSTDDEGGFVVAGNLQLRPLGSGSFVSLSPGSVFGMTRFIAADRSQYLTISFMPQVAVVASELLVIYPATGVDVEPQASLDLAARGVSASVSLKDLTGGVDDIFTVHDQLNLARPLYTQRMDLVFTSPNMSLPAGQLASVQLKVQLRSASPGRGWLLLTSRIRGWAQGGSISNTNMEIWPGGQPPFIQAFDPRSTLVSPSSTISSTSILVKIIIMPTIAVITGSWLRVAAPEQFTWQDQCVANTSPSGLVKANQCWRDLGDSRVVLLPVALNLEGGVVSEIWLQVLSPPLLSRPNLWEVAVLPALDPEAATSSTTSTTVVGFVAVPDEAFASALQDSRELHSKMLPLQISRVSGFQLDGLEAVIAHIHSETLSDDSSASLLLSFRLQAAPHLQGEELRLAATPLQLKLTAPYPVLVTCAAPGILGGGVEYPDGTVQYFNTTAVKAGWRLLATQQRLADMVRCKATGFQGEPGVSSSSYLEIDLGVPVRVGAEWLALQLRARSEDQQLLERSRLWALEVLGDGLLATTAFVESSPEELLTLQVGSTSDFPLSSAFGDCPGAFCAALVGDRLEINPAAALLVGRGRGGHGIIIDFAISMSTALKPTTAGLVGSRWTAAFRESSTFPAQEALGNFIQLTAPQPLRWLDGCGIANTSGISPGIWRCVCFGNSAYVHTLGYSEPPVLPLQEILSIQGILLDPLEGQPWFVPRSTVWVASWYEDGALLEQIGVDSQLLEDIPNITSSVSDESSENDTVRMANGPVVLPQHALDLEECSGVQEVYYPCPIGMFAYGIRMVRLGGAASSIDSLRLLCREELDVGTNHTQWHVQSGASGLVGNRQLLTLESLQGVEDLLCDEQASGLLVGLRLPAGRLQGLAAGCMPWTLVEREVSWDEGGEETSTFWGDLGNCTGVVPINGSELWADCQGIPDLRPCPDPDKCCCNENFQYSLQSQRCEACPTSTLTTADQPMQSCPSGMAVIGVEAGEATEGHGLPPQFLISTICSLRLHCGPLQPRHWAGSMSVPVISAFWEPVVEDSGLELGLVSLGLSFDWWHYAAGGGSLLLMCCCLCRCCSSQSSQVYGDVQPQNKANRTRVWSILKLPFTITWYVLIKPSASFAYNFILEPLWRRALRPALNWFLATRFARTISRLLARVARCFWKCITCFCPCLRRLEKVSAKKTLQALRNPVASGKAARNKVARRLEMRRQLMAGTFSPEKAKEDLVNQLKRGLIDEQELGMRQREIDDAVKAMQGMSDKVSMMDRLKKSKEMVNSVKSMKTSEALKKAKSVTKSSASMSFMEGGRRRGFCQCCRRAPNGSEDEIEEVEEEVVEEKQTESHEPLEEEDDEWEYFWEEEEEEEGLEDDQLVEPAASHPETVLGPVASQSETAPTISRM